MECPFFSEHLLNYGNIFCSWPFIPLLYIKCNSFAVFKRFKADRIDSCMMDKYIRAIFLFNKTISLFVIKPLYSSLCQNTHLLLNTIALRPSNLCLV